MEWNIKHALDEGATENKLYFTWHGFVHGYEDSKIQLFKDSRASGGNNCWGSTKLCCVKYNVQCESVIVTES
jgi:hypothetical protein